MFSIIHWDTETHQIAPGRPAPPPVCLQWLGVTEDGTHDGPHLLQGPDMADWFLWAIRSGVVLSGLNQAYDLLVMVEECIRAGVDKLSLWTWLFDWLAAGLQRCTEVRERLIRIARGLPDSAQLSLEDQAWSYLGLDLRDAKRAGYRLRFGELERWPALVACAAFPHVYPLRPDDFLRREALDDAATNIDLEATLAAAALPANTPVGWSDGQNFVACAYDILTPQQAAALLAGEIEPGSLRHFSTWPSGAAKYALDDVVIERQVYLAQEQVALEVFGQRLIPDEIARPVAKFSLHLSSARGLRTDGARAQRAVVSLERTLVELRDKLVDAGLMRRKIVHKGKPNERVEFSKNMDAIHGRIVAALAAAGHEAERKRPTAAMIERAEKAEAKGDLEKAAKLRAGNVRADKEVMQLAELADDEALRVKVAYDATEKLLSTYVRPLAIDCGSPVDNWCGLERPMSWRYSVLKNTGRTSAGKTRYKVFRAGQLAEERDGNNVQNYTTPDMMLLKARDVLSVIGYGEPGDGEYDEDDREHARELAASGVTYNPPDELGLSLQDFIELRELKWARRHDVRSMVIARDGYLLVNRDYSGIEMATLAQCQVIHFGYEVTLARVLNDTTVRELDLVDDKGRRVTAEGTDAHLFVAVFAHPILHGETLSYDELLFALESSKLKKKRGIPLTPLERRVNETRKMCKVINFGFLGGMGAATFVQYVWQRMRVRITVEDAKQLKAAWYAAFPEMPDWFRFIGDQVEQDIPVVQLGSGRVRGGCTFTQNANTRFQGLAADGALNAMFLIWRACLTDPTSPLYGCFPLVFEHDAFLVEVVADRAKEADDELARLMVEGMRALVPDVQVKTEGTEPSRRWGK